MPQPPQPASGNAPASKSEQDTPWYGDGLSFQCTQCGNCCTGPPGYVWFSREEGRAMARRVGVTEAEFYKKYASRKLGRWSLNEVRLPDGAYDCVFLRRDESGKALCSVYEARPTQCRTWPFWDSNLTSKRAWDASAKGCPGMKNGGVFVPADRIRVLVESNPRGL